MEPLEKSPRSFQLVGGQQQQQQQLFLLLLFYQHTINKQIVDPCYCCPVTQHHLHSFLYGDHPPCTRLSKSMIERFRQTDKPIKRILRSTRLIINRLRQTKQNKTTKQKQINTQS